MALKCNRILNFYNDIVCYANVQPSNRVSFPVRFATTYEAVKHKSVNFIVEWQSSEVNVNAIYATAFGFHYINNILFVNEKIYNIDATQL